MRMRVPPASVVDGHVRGHAERDQFGADPGPNQVGLLLVRQLTRKSQLELPCELGILPLLGGLHRVPERSTVAHPGGCMVRNMDLGHDQTTLPLEVPSDPSA